MPLGTAVSLGPGDIVLDGTHLPQKGRGQQPSTSDHVLWPNGWMDQDALGTKVGIGPVDIK